MNDYSTKFREELKNATKEQLMDMLMISAHHCYERAEIIKDAYFLLTATEQDIKNSEVELDVVLKSMEKVLDGFMIDKPY